MRVLFDHPHPFLLAHGGFQTQIEQTRLALKRRGVEVEWLRWWDDRPQGDLIHFFGVANTDYLAAARAKKLPVVMTTLFTETCNRPPARLRRQGVIVRTILALPGGEGIKRQLHWRAFGMCSHNIVGLAAERDVLELVYGLGGERISIVPLGLPEAFLKAGAGDRSGDFLVCAGTITERKNSVQLARMALATETPLLFVGKAYSVDDPYWREFSALIDDRFVRHQPHVNDVDEMIALLHRARGAVVASEHENWCLAAHEAAACGLPLLLPPLRWARERFGVHARYFDRPIRAASAQKLREFYDACPRLPAPAIHLYSWDEAAAALESVYTRVLSSSR